MLNAARIQTQLNSHYYFNLVSFSESPLLFYDYCLTIDWEISRYWGAPFTWPNILFFANRYGTLLGNVPVVIQYFWTQRSTPGKTLCRHLGSYHQYFIIVTQLIIIGAAMLILRTYALYERSRRILLLMLAVTVGAIAVAVWSVVTARTGTIDHYLHLYFGCDYAISHSQGVSFAIAWADIVVFDCMIFLLTLYKVLHRPRGADLLTVLLRDGSIYFGVIVMSNLFNILTFVLGSPYTRGIATTFTNIISSILITRLMLNIRDPALSHMNGRLSANTTVTNNPRFTPFVGPSGGSAELDTGVNMDMELTRIGAGVKP
ncbi:hypothetical protein B0H16DRAFT_1510809 [Mycena metata]|uniref:DUF6533 domain-containing protein n=1 Tax=Mycena metata TaxID=1033252 RepID=A0AAD7NTD9_9AGAR|nr:hypothetical protein B0H16DRAFT_1510809 [Mycena metata]